MKRILKDILSPCNIPFWFSYKENNVNKGKAHAIAIRCNTVEKNVNIDESNNVVGRGEEKICSLAKFRNKENCLKNIKFLHPNAGMWKENIESNGALHKHEDNEILFENNYKTYSGAVDYQIHVLKGKFISWKQSTCQTACRALCVPTFCFPHYKL